MFYACRTGKEPTKDFRKEGDIIFVLEIAVALA
jgi:hypothetical protein